MRWESIFIIVLLSTLVYAATSTITLSEGDTITIDGRDYLTIVQGTSEDVEITFFDQTVPADSRTIPIGGCFETPLKEVCVQSVTDCDEEINRVICEECVEVGNNITCTEINKTFDPNQDVLTEFKIQVSDREDNIDLSFTTDFDEAFLGQEIEVEINVLETGDVSNLNLSVFIPEDVTVFKTQVCKARAVPGGTLVELIKSNPSDDEECTFEMIAYQPFKFELSPVAIYELEGFSFKDFATAKTIEFKAPYEVTFETSEMNTSEDFKVNITFENLASKILDFENIEFHIPEELSVDGITGESEFGGEWYTLEEDDNFDPREIITYDFSFGIGKKQNFTIFIKPFYEFDDRFYQGEYFDVIEIKKKKEKGKKDEDRVSDVCKNKNLNVTWSLNDSVDYIAGIDLDFTISMKSMTKQDIENITAKIYDDNKLITEKDFGLLFEDEKKLISRIFTLLPFVEQDTEKMFRVETDYICSGNSYSQTRNFNVTIDSFGDLNIKKDVPKNIQKGEKFEVIVELNNKGDTILKDVHIEEMIPPQFEVLGVTSRTVDILEDEEIEAYAYELILQNDNQTEYDIVTVATLNFGSVDKVEQDKKTLKLDRDFEDEVDIELETEDIRLREPFEVQFIVKNERNYLLEDVTIRLERDEGLDLGPNEQKFSFLAPNQTVFFNVPIFGREKNFTFNVTVIYENRTFSYEEKPDEYLKQSDRPYVEYSVETFEYLDGSATATFDITNPTLDSITVTVVDENVTLEPGENLIIQKGARSIEEVEVSYKILNVTYLVTPTSVSEDKEVVVVKEEKPPQVEEEVVDEPEPKPQRVEIEDSEEEESPFDLLDYVIYGAIGVIVIVAIVLLSLGNLKPRKKKVKPEKEERLLEESHLSDVEEVEVVEEQSTGKQDITSFDDYDRFKEELEKLK